MLKCPQFVHLKCLYATVGEERKALKAPFVNLLLENLGTAAPFVGEELGEGLSQLLPYPLGHWFLWAQSMLFVCLMRVLASC